MSIGFIVFFIHCAICILSYLALFFSAKLSVFMHPQIQKVDIGESVALKCVISGSPVRFVKWLKDGILTKAFSDMESSSVFSIRSVIKSTQGMYQCFAGNEMEVRQASGQILLSGL